MRIRLLTLLLLIISASAGAQRLDSVVLKTRTGSIYGTLTIPQHAKRDMPVVIIIPGSGPTDRNGNNGIATNNSLRMLSDSLAKYGIASLRYDKRGIGASKAAADESKLRFSHYVADVSDWIRKLRKDRRFGDIYVAGHSEGSLIGMIAVQQTRVAGFISIAGAGAPADALILKQLAALPGVHESTVDSVGMFFSELKNSGRIEHVPNGFYASIFRPSVQGYLLSWIKHDPSVEIAGVKAPTLIIQGTTDMQVDTVQAHKLLAARPDAQLLIIPNMNHIFKNAPPDDPQFNQGTYFDAGMPIRTELVQGLAGFIKGQK